MPSKIKTLISSSLLEKNSPFFYAICITLTYWAYLFLNSSMDIKYDAVGYQLLGDMIYQSGWSEYLKDGPHREPMYPFIISISMHLSDLFRINYQSIQMFIQLAFLFVTQILFYVLLKKLHIRPLFSFLAVLYIGLSPALVNSALSLFSEIITYPLILGIILIGISGWQRIVKKLNNIVFCALGVGILFGILSLSKAIFEFMAPLFLSIYAFLIIAALKNNQQGISTHSMRFILIAFISFQAFIIPLKLNNYKESGQFSITGRGPWLLYGTAAKRTEPINPKIVMSGIATAAGDNVCKSLFDEKSCQYWHFLESDKFGRWTAHNLMRKKMNDKEINKELLNMTKKKILNNPFQYIFVTLIESLKLFFWESTRIGFVNYPPLIEKIFSFKLFKNAIRLIISFLTIISFIFLFWKNLHNRKQIFQFGTQKNQDEVPLACLILIFLVGFIGLSSLITPLTRYALPIAPLYLLIIAYCAEKLMQKFRS